MENTKNKVTDWMNGKDIIIAKIYTSFGINESSTDAEKAAAFNRIVNYLSNYFSLYELTEFADWLSPNDEEDEDILDPNNLAFYDTDKQMFYTVSWSVNNKPIKNYIKDIKLPR